MSTVIHSFGPDERQARALAESLAIPFGLVSVHRFPDGETLPAVPAAAATVIVYCSLFRPDRKLIALILAADAWRRAGATRLVLVAPYLCYLRQDAVFAPGQPLSRDVIAPLIGARFDRIVTVDAHRHRTGDLGPVFGCPVEDLSAAAVLAEALGPGDGEPTVVVGPDEESLPWVGKLAARLGAESLTFRKVRLGDRRVRLETERLASVRGRRVLLTDDICSTGGTLAGAIACLREAGAARIEIGVVHALFTARTELRLRKAGAARIVSTNSIPHPTNAASLTPLLAEALGGEIT